MKEQYKISHLFFLLFPFTLLARFLRMISFAFITLRDETSSTECSNLYFINYFLWSSWLDGYNEVRVGHFR